MLQLGVLPWELSKSPNKQPCQTEPKNKHKIEVPPSHLVGLKLQRTHALILFLTVPLSSSPLFHYSTLSLFHSLSNSPNLSHSLSLTLTLSLSHCSILPLSHSHYHSLMLPLSLSHSFTHTLPLSHSFTFPLSSLPTLLPSHSHSLPTTLSSPSVSFFSLAFSSTHPYTRQCGVDWQGWELCRDRGSFITL